MGVEYCQYCGRYIDLDYNVEHFPIQSDGCYDTNKCIGYYEEYLTVEEEEIRADLAEARYAMGKWFRSQERIAQGKTGYRMYPWEVESIKRYASQLSRIATGREETK